MGRKLRSEHKNFEVTMLKKHGEGFQKFGEVVQIQSGTEERCLKLVKEHAKFLSSLLNTTILYKVKREEEETEFCILTANNCVCK